MRSIRLLVAGLTILAVAACATSTPGWTYAPAPAATPIPSADASASAGPSGSAAPSASAAPAASAAPSASSSAAASPAASPAEGASAAPASVVELTAENVAFTPTDLTVAADVAFDIKFNNNDPAVPHNVDIKDANGVSVFKGDIFPGVETRTYNVLPLPAGAYTFVCDVHANMTGTLTSQ